MSKAEVTQRLMCAEGKVESQRLRTGKLAVDDWPRLTAACDKLAKAPIYVDDTGSITMMEIRSKLRRLKMKEPELGLVIVDYLQLMTSGTSVENRVQEVSQISRALKVLARDLEVPIVALSQLSRAVEQRHDKRPILSDLRECGSIEQDADLVMFVYRDEYYNPEDTESAGIAELILSKHRNGATGIEKLAFQKRYAKFADLAARRMTTTSGSARPRRVSRALRDVPRVGAHARARCSPTRSRVASRARLDRAGGRRDRARCAAGHQLAACGASSARPRSRVPTTGNCSSHDRAAARLARPGGDDLRGAVRGVPGAPRAARRTTQLLVQGSLRREADVGFTTCRRGHRIVVRRVARELASRPLAATR